MLAVIVLIGVLGLVAYLIISRKPVKEVLLLRPRDKRGLVVPVAQESDLVLICKKTGGIVRRFIKVGCSWTFTIRGKVVTRFLGIEGTAYTAVYKAKQKTIVTFEQALRFLWGDEWYDKIPDEQKEAIEKHKWGVTVEVEPIIEKEKKLKPISSEDLHDAEDDVVLGKIAQGQGTSKKMDIYNFAMGAVAGGFIMYLAVMQGWL